MSFNVFDTATGFEQVRFVNQGNRKASVLVTSKEILKQVRVPMRVNDESVDSYAYQMIERKSYERLLKNWDERLGQLLC